MISQYPVCRKTRKKIEEGTFWGIFIPKKVSQCRKKLKRGTRYSMVSIVRYSMLRVEPFSFSSLGQQVQFDVFLKFCRTFDRTILVTSGGLRRKAMTIVDSFEEKRRLKRDEVITNSFFEFLRRF